MPLQPWPLNTTVFDCNLTCICLCSALLWSSSDSSITTSFNAGSVASTASDLSCVFQVGHQVAVRWAATDPLAVCAAAKLAWVKCWMVKAWAALAKSNGFAPGKLLNAVSVTINKAPSLKTVLSVKSLRKIKVLGRDEAHELQSRYSFVPTNR